MLHRRTHVASSVALSLFAAVAFGALMQHSETTIPIPASGEKTPLSKLEYRARFVASLDELVTIHEMMKEAGSADPISVKWQFTGSNTDGQAHRVEISLRLLDEAGSRLATYSKRAVLAAGAKGQQIALSTDVKPEVWKAAKKVRIFADWMS
jgi:hypothetical protein